MLPSITISSSTNQVRYIYKPHCSKICSLFRHRIEIAVVYCLLSYFLLANVLLISIDCFRDILKFWSTVGQAQFPSLCSLARVVLSVRAACTVYKRPSSLNFEPVVLSSLLRIRTSNMQVLQEMGDSTSQSSAKSSIS